MNIHDFLSAEQTLDFLIRNLAIQFDLTADTMTAKEAKRNLLHRACLIQAKGILLDEAERLLKEAGNTTPNQDE